HGNYLFFYFKLGHIRLVMIWFNDTKLKILIETAKEALSDIRAVYIKETKENRSSGKYPSTGRSPSSSAKATACPDPGLGISQ
ncbi:hypothetical protein, partial [Bacteroides heparinolyticus]